MNPRITKIILLAGLLLLLFMLPAVYANNIQVTNVTLTNQNTAEGYWLVQFDLSWENSWRTDNLFPDDGHDVGNWDAAWVFVKYRVGEGEWLQAKLHNSDHNTGSGTPANIDIGLPDERSDFHSADNPGVGAFVYRSENGNGTFNGQNLQLRWNYGVDDVPHGADIDLRVLAIEMVYVAPGPFYLGSGGDEVRRFYERDTNLPDWWMLNTPFKVTENWNGCIAPNAGCLWNTSANSDFEGNLEPHFPTGVDGLYSMKYSITQQQYVDFLNLLTYEQQNRRVSSSPSGEAGSYVRGGSRYRHAIKIKESGVSESQPAVYETEHPYVALNWLSWMDGAAYSDWAGLRPMTELEYEKTARGPADPVPNEFSWGTTSITAVTEIVNDGLADEGPVPSTANANYDNWANDNLEGPLRVGSFATGTTNRVQAGASYWGIMELSSNLTELIVTIENFGDRKGRFYTGLHGTGVLQANGDGAVLNWPGGGSEGISDADGIGSRGGSWATSSNESLRISSRLNIMSSGTYRDFYSGFRSVRSLPQHSDNNGDDEISTVTNPVTGRTWMDRNLGATRVATSSTDTLAYGDLYQWGRGSDGHQKRSSLITSTLSSSDQPDHGDFIVSSNSPYDWRTPQSDNQWQGINGINNPCPSGFRLPTVVEWSTEIQSWSSSDAVGAFSSPLKLPMSGRREGNDGSIPGVGRSGVYWSSTVDGIRAELLWFISDSVTFFGINRTTGASIRCIED